MEISRSLRSGWQAAEKFSELFDKSQNERTTSTTMGVYIRTAVEVSQPF
jgi:hypothetical protein